MLESHWHIRPIATMAARVAGQVSTQERMAWDKKTGTFHHGGDPTLSEPPTLDGANGYYRTHDGGRGGGVRCWPTERPVQGVQGTDHSGGANVLTCGNARSE